ncbi:hypothetical protein SBA3_2500008 [Candidatus Sulfopaludibacter sp. SbA3]|nr:hypothetical protein SBA3_2500008 [Candidatus Sulfopaludibacter sp. SbA3]
MSSVGMGVPPAKLHEKPESVTPAVLPPVRRAKRAVAQPRPLTPGPWPLFFDPVNLGRPPGEIGRLPTLLRRRLRARKCFTFQQWLCFVS